MNRDGNATSLWQAVGADYQPTNQWDTGQIYDVLIIGGGITGLTTALLLQEGGMSCLVAEAHNIGFGTTGGTTAHLNTMLDAPYNTIIQDFGVENARLVGAGARQAIEFVGATCQRLGIDAGFAHRPGYLLANGEQEEKELADILEGARQAHVAVTSSPAAPAPLPHTQAGIFENQAQVHPTTYIYGLAQAFEQAGGVILQHCVAAARGKKEDYFETETSLGKVFARRVVYATHIPPGINILHFRCAPYRSYALACTLKNGDYPDALIYDMKNPYHYIRTQDWNGQQYLVAGGCDNKTGHGDNQAYAFTELEAFVREMYEVDEVAYRWSSQYFESTDGLPYIGQNPGDDEQVYCATGYSGNGITLGTLAGIVLSDILLGKETPFEKLFYPGRVKPVAGFAAFVEENADVISQFIGKRFAYEKIKELAALAPGEGKLAEWEGQKVALYKDETGKIYAVDPVCPHARCVVDWNNAEQSWDCPCHGSRFAPNGTLLTGPARKGLEPLMQEDFEGD